MKRYFFILFLLLFAQISAADALRERLQEQLPRILSEISEVRGEFVSVDPFFGGGKSLINDVYLIKTDREELVIKLGNPRWEKSKTENEVAVVNFLYKNSAIPVPKIYAYEASQEHSAMGREYIIMAKIEGEPMSSVYSDLIRDKEQFYSILSQLASILAELRSFHFDAIGNFRIKEDCSLTMKGIIDFPEGNSLRHFPPLLHMRGHISVITSMR